MATVADGFVAREQIRRDGACPRAIRCQTPWMGRFILSMTRASVGGVSGCIIALGAVFLGCGGGAGDGADPATSNPPGASSEDGDGSDGAGVNGSSDGAGVNRASTAACRGTFSACGGLLAGAWEVEETCGTNVPDHREAEAWSRERLGLDAAACPSTVTKLDSVWNGQLSFKNGDAVDTRTRRDSLELDLTRECLSASYGIADGDVDATCAGLSDDSLECAAQSGGCHCSGQREELSNATGVYGVLGLSVAVGRSPSPAVRYEYCVDGDHLFWKDVNQIVLRRISDPEPPTNDPIDLPR